MAQKLPIHPLLNTTYQLHRLSPLYNFPTLNPSDHPPLRGFDSRPRHTQPSPFKSHERALTNTLKGEVLRGVTVGSEDHDNSNNNNNDLGGLGKFKQCKWRLVPTFSAIREWIAENGDEKGDEEEEEDDQFDDEEDSWRWQRAVRERRDVAGVEITFEYRRGVTGYVAYLIGPPSNEETETGEGEGAREEGFTNLPLLLTRLPKALVDALYEYISVTFDTLPLPMGVVGNVPPLDSADIPSPPPTMLGDELSLANGWLAEQLEMFLSHTKNSAGKLITLVFRIPHVKGLKTITIEIPKKDVDGFLVYGRRSTIESTGNDRKRKRKAEDGDDHGGGSGLGKKGPFMTAISRYIKGVMGMDIDKLLLIKIGCAGFIAGGGGAAAGSSTVPANGTTKEKPDVEATGSSGRIKIFIPQRRQRADEDMDADETREERSGEEIAAEKFLESLVELAGKKTERVTPEKDGNVVIENARKKKKNTGGKVPGKRIVTARK